MKAEDMTWAEEETQKLLDEAERWLFENKGMAWKDLSELDKHNWMVMLMDLSDHTEIFGDHLSDITKGRISFIKNNYPKMNRTEKLFFDDAVVQALDNLREMSQDDYLKTFINDENEE
jgi:hypothetical protein